MALTTSGIGSGLDIDSLVSQLVAAEGQAPLLRLNKREASFQADLSAFGQLKSALSEFKTALAGMNDEAAFQPRSVSTSNLELFTATGDNTATPSTYNIEVLSLAQSEKVRSSSFSSNTEVIGTGTLDISLGTSSFQVDVDGTNNTLTGIRDAINVAFDNPGITASLVNVDGGPQLVLSSNTIGSANTITIVATDDDGADGFDLARLDSTNLTVTQAAADATFNLDGQLVTRGSNSFSDVMTGVTIDLKKAEIGTTETLTVALNEGGVESKVNSIVKAYNSLTDLMKDLSKYDAESNTAGILQGNSTIRGIQTQLRKIISEPQNGLTYGSLAEIGVKTDESGHLVVDSEQFNKVVAADFTSVSKLFVGDDALVSKLDSTLNTYLATDGILESKTKSLKIGIDGVADSRLDLNKRLAAIEKRYKTQFNAMDTLLGQLRSTGDFLTQQLENLPGVVRQTK